MNLCRLVNNKQIYNKNRYKASKNMLIYLQILQGIIGTIGALIILKLIASKCFPGAPLLKRHLFYAMFGLFSLVFPLVFLRFIG